MRTWKAPWNNMILGRIFDAKKGGLACRKPSWRVVLVTIYEISVVREKVSKMKGKMPSTTVKLDPSDAHGAELRIMHRRAGSWTTRTTWRGGRT